jgi:hypothetical protein
MENCHHWKFSLFSFGRLGLGCRSPLAILKMVVDKMHAYEACGKKLIQKRAEMRENLMIKICMSNVSF